MVVFNEKIRTEVDFESHFGKTVSRRKEYFDNGVLYREGVYTRSQGGWGWDVPMGPVKTFYKNGVLKSSELFDEFGNREGESTYHNAKGELLKRIIYSADKVVNEENFEVVPEKRFAKSS